MWLAVIGVVFLSPFLALVGAILRAVWLFWPTMIVLGAVHSWLPYVPALGWVPVFWVVALLALLIPTGSSVTKD